MKQPDADVDIVEVEPGVYSVIVGDESFEARIAGNQISVGGYRFTVEVDDPRQWKRSRHAAGAQGRVSIAAAMPGKLIRVLVAVGDEVTEGQGIMVVEAMKMQNELKAPRGGRVTSIAVKPNESVIPEQSLPSSSEERTARHSGGALCAVREFDVVGVGLNATDTVLIVPRFPAYGGKAPFTREFYSVGGQVATAMVTCARLGLRAKYIGTVGDDERGRIQMESLRISGIDIAHVQRRTNCPNQSAYIVVDESTGERTIFWSRPDCLTISPGQIDAGTDRLRAAAAHRRPRYARRGACGAHRAAGGIPVTVDVDTIYAGFDRVLPLVDYLIASSEFPARWTGIEDPLRSPDRDSASEPACALPR